MPRKAAPAGVIEGLDLKEITLVPHDLGGLAGLAAIARTPERIRGTVGINAFAWKPAYAQPADGEHRHGMYVHLHICYKFLIFWL
jgi:pimeloyl-ACP methyl ester carboxylesterase